MVSPAPKGDRDHNMSKPCTKHTWKFVGNRTICSTATQNGHVQTHGFYRCKCGATRLGSMSTHQKEEKQ